MPSRKRASSFEKLGVDITSSEMQVFRAVLIAAGGINKPASYNEIATSLESIAGKKYTKAYIYRRLNSLEEDGFIIVDTIHTCQGDIVFGYHRWHVGLYSFCKL